MSGWCCRCAQYDVWGKGCRCVLIGRAWRPESGQTEDDASEVWSVHEAESAIKSWASRTDARNCYEVFEHQQTIAIRLSAGRVRYFTVRRESEPVYYVEKADDAERAQARHEEARTRRAERRYWCRRREHLGAPIASASSSDKASAVSEPVTIKDPATSPTNGGE